MKGFIICSVDYKHSLQLANDSLNSAKQFNIDASIVEAVNGNASVAQTLISKYNLKVLKHKNRNLTNGEIGCFLSHFLLWQKCLELNEPILIFEHDGLMIRLLPLDVLDHFNDILMLDPYKPSINIYESMIEKSLQHPIDYFVRKSDSTDDGGDYQYSAYGYIIKPHAAQKLINFALEVGIHPTDVHMGRKIVDVKTTTTTVVRLHPFFSGNSLIHQSLTCPYSRIK